jgi:hypothetical protein
VRPLYGDVSFQDREMVFAVNVTVCAWAVSHCPQRKLFVSLLGGFIERRAQHVWIND